LCRVCKALLQVPNLSHRILSRYATFVAAGERAAMLLLLEDLHRCYDGVAPLPTSQSLSKHYAVYCPLASNAPLGLDFARPVIRCNSPCPGISQPLTPPTTRDRNKADVQSPKAPAAMSTENAIRVPDGHACGHQPATPAESCAPSPFPVSSQAGHARELSSLPCKTDPRTEPATYKSPRHEGCSHDLMSIPAHPQSSPFLCEPYHLLRSLAHTPCHVQRLPQHNPPRLGASECHSCPRAAVDPPCGEHQLQHERSASQSALDHSVDPCDYGTMARPQQGLVVTLDSLWRSRVSRPTNTWTKGADNADDHQHPQARSLSLGCGQLDALGSSGHAQSRVKSVAANNEHKQSAGVVRNSTRSEQGAFRRRSASTSSQQQRSSGQQASRARSGRSRSRARRIQDLGPPNEELIYAWLREQGIQVCLASEREYVWPRMAAISPDCDTAHAPPTP
jgi:hypothetical protein